MADSAAAAALPAAATKKRRREGGDLKRVAEIVMVLAAAGEMRGGKPPTAAEKALAEEARERLAGACEEAVRPRDLVTKEAVCAVVEELGLNRSNSATGFRPPKMSIADRLLITKRKMEEPRQAPVHSPAYSPQNNLPTMAAGASPGVHGTNVLHGHTRFAAVGVPQNASAVAALPAVSQVAAASPSLKQPLVNDTQRGASSVRPPSIPSVVALAQSGATHLRFDGRVNGPPYLAQTGVSAASVTLGQTNKLLHDASSRSNLNAVPSSNQVISQEMKTPTANLVVRSQEVKTPTVNQVMRSQEVKTPTTQAVSGKPLAGTKSQKGLAFIPPQNIFANHNEIANKVQHLLQQTSTNPAWIPPSTDYMNVPLDCMVCKVTIADVESVLVCDACERGAHLKCLQSYGSKGIPKPEWHCPTCLMASHGKPLPPKYGKVTRTFVPPKGAPPAACLEREEKPVLKDTDQKRTSVLPKAAPSLASLERAEEKPVLKNKDHKVVANGNPTVSYTTSVSNTVHEIGLMALNAKSVVSEPQASSSTTSTEIQDVSNTGTLSNHQGEIEKPAFSVNSGSTGQHSMKMESTNDSMLQPSGVSAKACLNPSYDVAIGETNQSEAPSRSHDNNETEVTDNIRTKGDQTHETNGITVENRRKHSVSQEPEGSAGVDAISDDAGTHQETSNGGLHPTGEQAGCGAVLRPVAWVGDVLKVVDGKAYYNSCHIGNVSYKLEDHVLFASENDKLVPSKLQSLWEDNESGVKMATVELYYFASDLPESVSTPSTAEDNEVYASQNPKSIMACSICGPCEVLPVDKFREESERRSGLGNTDTRLPAIFVCRWNYDEERGVFDSATR